MLKHSSLFTLLFLSSLILLSLFPGCSGCLPTTPVTVTGTIYGYAASPDDTVKDLSGYSPIAGATVTIVDADGVTHTVITDEDGYYFFNNISIKANTIINIEKDTEDGGKLIFKDVVPLAVSVEEDYDAGIADAESTAIALVVEELINLDQVQEEIDLDEITSSEGFDELKEDIAHAQQNNQDINTDLIITQAEEIAYNIVNPPYTVIFRSQGGSVVSSQIVNRGGKVTRPRAPRRTGYTFGGWYKESGCTNAWNFDTDTVTSDVTLYAKWTINTYTVTFDKNSGDTEADPTTKTATHGGNVGTLPTAPTRTGYTFSSWNTEIDGSGTEFTAATAVTADLTVYAKWTINTYTLTMSKTGSGTGTTTPATGIHTYDYGTSVTISASPASSSTFTGWSGDAEGTSNVELSMTANKNVTATFTLKTYTITASAGANGSISPSGGVSVNHGANRSFTITAATNYHIADVLVDGSSVGAVSSYNFTNVTANHTIAATFAIDTYTVTFDKNSGDTEADPTTKTATHGGNVGTLPTAPTRTGYTFSSWNTETDGSGTEFTAATAVTADLTVYAKWTPLYALRDTGPAGGLIFYVKEGGYSDGWMYMEAAPSDQSASIQWAIPTYFDTNVTGTLLTLGSGSANTDKIINQNGVGASYAAGLARDYEGGGKTDWFLPSRDELDLMYKNLHQQGVEGFTVDDYYWSSSEFEPDTHASHAWVQHFSTGYKGSYDKDIPSHVRAVRAF